MKLCKLTKEQMMQIIVDQSVLLTSYENIFRIRILGPDCDITVPEELYNLAEKKPSEKKKTEEVHYQ